MDIPIQMRRSIRSMFLVGVFIGASAALPAAPSLARDAASSSPRPPFTGAAAAGQLDDNVSTDTSTASFDDTVKWLTENLLKNGSSRYTKVVTIGGTHLPLKTNEAIIGAEVKSDVLELKIHTEYAGEAPSRTEVTETLSVPLRLIKRVSTSDGDPAVAAALARGKHALPQFTYVTLTLSCEHNDIEDRAATRTTSQDIAPAVSDSTDIVSELNIHIGQSYDYCQRVERAIRHLAKLARAMPPSNLAEPF